MTKEEKNVIPNVKMETIDPIIILDKARPSLEKAGERLGEIISDTIDYIVDEVFGNANKMYNQKRQNEDGKCN